MLGSQVHTFVPFGQTLLYPLTLLCTWVHEMEHGMTALAAPHLNATADAWRAALKAPPPGYPRSPAADALSVA